MVKPKRLNFQIRKLKIAISLLLVLSFFAFFSPSVQAATGITKQINFQGKIVNKTSGTNITNGNYNMVFQLYDASSAGNSVWGPESWTGGNQVAVTDGIFRVSLGSITSMASTDFNQDALWLQITFNGEAMGSRVRLTAAPYAFQADKVTGLSVASGKTLTASNTLTFTGTDGTSFALPSSSGTIATLDATQELTNKTIGSTGLTFSAATTDITTGTNEDFVISPNGLGKIGLGITAPVGKLHLRGAAAGKALAIFDEIGDQNIFEASASGVPKLSITRTGSIVFEGSTNDSVQTILTMTDPTASDKTITLPNASGTVAVSASGAISLSAAGDISCATCLASGGSLFTLTGTDSGTNQSIDQGETLTIAAGTGIDTTPSNANTLTVAFDATEISGPTWGTGANTWTFESGATDPTIGFASDAFTFTAGTSTFTGDTAINGGDITTTSGTFNVSNAATTLNLGSTAVTRAINIGTGTNADTISIGTGGTTADVITIGTGATANTITIGSSSSTTVSITDDNWSISTAGLFTTADDAAINGGDITTSAATFNVANAATTLNLGSTNVTRAINIGTGTNADTISIGTGGTNADVITIGTAATANTITIGSSSSTTVSITDNNWSITAAGLITTADDVAVNGGDITTSSASFNLANAATTLNLGSTNVTRAINIGTGTNADTISIGTGGTTADVITIGTAATANTITIGSSSSTTVSITDNNWSITAAGLFTTADDIALNGGDLTTSSATFNLVNAATTLNIGSTAVTRGINIGTGTNADTINIGTGGTTADVINIGTAATANTIAIGSSSSTTVSITDNNWSISAAGSATFANIGIGAAPAYAIEALRESGSTNGLDVVARYFQTSTGTVAAGFGYVNQLMLENDSGTTTLASDFGARWSGVGANDDGVFFIRTGTNGSVSETLTVLASGNVGIGNANPLLKLEVEGNIEFDIDTVNDTQIGVCKDLADGNTDVEFRECSTFAQDIAEFYAAEASLQPGDVVRIDYMNGKPTLLKTDAAYQSQSIGVVSTYPVGQFGKPLGEGAFKVEDNPTAIGLVGKVPVKVSLENGDINAGDALTSSAQFPGVAMKATQPGKIIGYALEPYNGGVNVSTGVREQEAFRRDSIVKFNAEPQDPTEAGIGKILMYINSGWFEPVDLNTEINITQSGGGFSTEDLSQSMENGLSITLGKEEDLTILDTLGNSVVSIDAEGNATFAGLLLAKKIKAEQIEGLELLVGSTIASREASLTPTPAAEAELGGSLALVEGLSVNGSATVSAQLHVEGSTLIEGILNVIDSITTGNLIVGKWADFIGSVIFRGDVHFMGRPMFNKDTAGFAVIKKDAQRVEVVFDKEYTNTPMVNITLSYDDDEFASFSAEQVQAAEQTIIDTNYQYFVSKLSAKGFTIVLNKPAQQDLKFSWTALAPVEPTITESTVSVTPTGVVEEVVSVTPTVVVVSPTIVPEDSDSATSAAVTE